MKRFKSLIAVILLGMQLLAAQTSAHKTYSGPYDEGTATYTYIDAPDGSRIFDGKFTYRTKYTTLTGNMKNDHQVGTWKYTSTAVKLFDYKNLTKVETTFTFDDNGLLSGPVVYKDYFKNGTVIVSESYSFDEGSLDGAYNYVNWEDTRYKQKGEYRQGKRVGKWHITYPGKGDVVVDYDDVDEWKRPKITQYDPTTGDKIAKYDVTGIVIRKPKSDNISCIRGSNMTHINTNLSNYLDCKNSADYSSFFMKNSNFTTETFPVGAEASVRFIVEKDGTVSDIRFYKSVNDSVDAEICRILKSMNHISSNDNPERIYVKLSIEFPDYVRTDMIKEIERKKQYAKEQEEANMLASEPEPFELSNVDVRPQFPGGEDAMRKYVANKLRYPAYAMENDIQGTVTVVFAVRSNGSIGEIKVPRSIDKSLDKEAMRIIKSMPKFTPGQKDGKPVPVWVTCPVVFKL